MAESVREAAAYGLGYLGVIMLLLAGSASGVASKYREENEGATLLESYRHGIGVVSKEFTEMSKEIIRSYKELCDKEMKCFDA